MGKAARWLRGLFGGKGSGSGVPPPEKDKRRWGFVKSFREKEKEKGRNPTPPPMRSYRAVVESDSAAGSGVGFRDEQNKRAIAVAAATAAVAEAAVAAAHAAAAVVRLTSSGRGAVGFGAGRREWAAVKIQAAFRGYLARRALRALKGLVKLQALVRGNIVRKQAAETLRCMHALLRVQARTRACRALRSEKTRPDTSSRSHPGPPTPEKFESANPATATKSDGHCSLKRNPSKPSSTSAAGSERTTQSSGWNWLDRWMEERYWDSREATPTKSRNGSAMDDEKNAKILEIDTGKPHPKRRSNHHHSSCSTLTSDNHSRSFATMHDSPSKDSTVAHQSIPSPSSVEMQHSPIPLRFPAVEVNEFESPQFYSASSRPGSSRRGPFTPSKSECSRSLFSGFSDYPNYMANTQSSKAKVRSHSAPRQRPEFDKSGSVKRLFGHQQHSAPSAQRSSSVKSGSKAYPGSGRLDRLGMPIRITSGF